MATLQIKGQLRAFSVRKDQLKFFLRQFRCSAEFRSEPLLFTDRRISSRRMQISLHALTHSGRDISTICKKSHQLLRGSSSCRTDKLPHNWSAQKWREAEGLKKTLEAFSECVCVFCDGRPRISSNSDRLWDFFNINSTVCLILSPELLSEQLQVFQFQISISKQLNECAAKGQTVLSQTEAAALQFTPFVCFHFYYTKLMNLWTFFACCLRS